MNRTSSFGVITHRVGLGLMAAALCALPACDGGSSGDPDNRGAFRVSLISTGLGQVFPYRIRAADAQGNPTTTVLNIEDLDTLKNNVSGTNKVLPVATFSTTATLPNGAAGNQFLLMRFSHKLDINSILSDQLANQTNSGLTTAVSLLAYNPTTEATTVIDGRGFVGGYTYFNRGGQLELVQAVENQSGSVVVLDGEAAGFPTGFTGDTDLVAPQSFVFVPDADGDLSTVETFPSNTLLRVIVTNAVRNSENKVLEHEVCTATTVGADPNPPDVLGVISGSRLEINPGNGETNVDPTTSILVRFNKPVQPADVGTFFDPENLIPDSGGVTIQVQSGSSSFPMIYYADPVGFGDFCNYRLQPAYPIPGQAQVDVTVNGPTVGGLTINNLGNTATTDYTTGDGPGLVNAPVCPEVVYVGMGGSEPGLGVIDLNGFGQGTGDINNTRFPNNPNVGAPGVVPPLSPGDSNLNAGSAGVFTMTQDTNGETRLLREPLIGQIGDIQVGNPLDLVFNNQNINRNSNASNQINPLLFLNQPGNSIAIAPHPNPPPLIFPPPNPARAIFGQEPTQTSSAGPPGAVFVSVPPCSPSPVNLLNVGNPFSSQPGEIGVFGAVMPGVFYGPQPPPGSPPPPTPFCPFTSRQQIGHFLYVLDRDNRQVLVVNSNRMTVLDTIRLTDPIDMAVSPNLMHLAVSNFSSGSVTFIDINPLSPTFHTIIGESRVDPGPTAVVYQPDNEDVIVLSTPSNTASIISATDFSVRKVVSGFLNQPVDVAVTERYNGTGNLSTIYYAYILNADGTIAIYESGPTGVNGFGFDDIIGSVPNVSFKRARKLRIDYNSSGGAPAITNFGAVFVAHVDDGGLGQVSRLTLTSSPVGALSTNQNQGGFIVPPTFRQKEWTVTQRFGGVGATTPVKDLFSGNSPVDMTVDEIVNNGAAADQLAPNIPLPPTGHSGKGAVKTILGFVAPPSVPNFLFVALGDVGKVDVFELSSGRRLATIDAPGVNVLGTYWRQ